MTELKNGWDGWALEGERNKEEEGEAGSKSRRESDVPER